MVVSWLNGSAYKGGSFYGCILGVIVELKPTIRQLRGYKHEF